MSEIKTASFRKPFLFSLSLHFHFSQSHQFIFKEEFRHYFHIFHNRCKSHLVENIFLKINARSNLRQVNAVFSHFKYGPFCDIVNVLSVFTGILPAEGNVVYDRYEFANRPFLNNSKLTVFYFFLQLTGRKSTAENNILRIRVILTKPPQPAIRGPNLETLILPVPSHSARPRQARSNPPPS